MQDTQVSSISKLHRAKNVNMGSVHRPPVPPDILLKDLQVHSWGPIEPPQGSLSYFSSSEIFVQQSILNINAHSVLV